AISVAWLTRLPVDGRYFWDLFPAFVLGGAGLGTAFVPITISSLAGVERSDAGVASGLVNTSRQIGGALGVAAISAIATTAAHGYATTHGVSAIGGEALDHGFRVAMVVLAGVLVVAAAVAVTFVRPQARPERAEAGELEAVKEAA